MERREHTAGKNSKLCSSRDIDVKSAFRHDNRRGSPSAKNVCPRRSCANGRQSGEFAADVQYIGGTYLYKGAYMPRSVCRPTPSSWLFRDGLWRSRGK